MVPLQPYAGFPQRGVAQELLHLVALMALFRFMRLLQTRSVILYVPSPVINALTFTLTVQLPPCFFPKSSWWSYRGYRVRHYLQEARECGQWLVAGLGNER